MKSATAPDLDWERDGASWPLHEFSQFVAAGGLRWHVQKLGQGPPLLLVHGAGASTHSWRLLAPLLAMRCSILTVDLPGHGFTTGTPAGGMSLPGVCAALAALLRELAIRPALAVGHSAGAAIIVRMALDRQFDPRGLISLNGALLPFDGMQALVYRPLAKMMTWTPLASQLFSWAARDRGSVQRLIAGTGSKLDATGVDLYCRLVRSPSHVAGVLQMMAEWDLDGLAQDLPRLATPLALCVGDNDRTIPADMAARVQALLPEARLVRLPGLGHLAHEEEPATLARTILDFADQWHVADAG